MMGWMAESRTRSWLKGLRWFTWGLIALAGGLLGLGWAALPLESWARPAGPCLISLITALWVGSHFGSGSLRWERLPSAGLVGLVLLAAGELYLGPGKVLPALAVALALLGWELELFLRRLWGLGRVKPKLILHHLVASGLTVGTAVALLLVGFYLRLGLTFGLTLLLAVVGFASLVVILRLARSGT